MAAGVRLQKKMTIGMIARFTAGLETEDGQGEEKRVAYCRGYLIVVYIAVTSDYCRLSLDNFYPSSTTNPTN